jgi:hypothetical protein
MSRLIKKSDNANEEKAKEIRKLIAIELQYRNVSVEVSNDGTCYIKTYRSGKRDSGTMKELVQELLDKNNIKAEIEADTSEYGD